MPIHVTIAINSETIETLHIGRIEGGINPDDVNTYLAVLGDEPVGLENWQKYGSKFQHRYGDGALTCVRKALQALELEVGYKRLSRDPEEIRLKLQQVKNRQKAMELKVNLAKADHHCGYDFEIWKPTAVCACGAIATNPFYVWNGT